MNLPRIDLIPLQSAVCSDRPTTLDVLVRLTPPTIELDTKRPSLNIGFVIDRSGSMGSHNKIDYARKAACYAIEQLLPSDRLSVTIFDDQVQTLIPNTPANNKARFVRQIQQIQPGGSTALHGGWLQGSIQVSQYLSAQLNRVILLSDGLANVGETNPDRIATDVHGLTKRGISTSTMGVGDNYNEDLLSAMASSGDGNYYYIASPEQLPGIFERELTGLVATVGTNVALAIAPQGNVVVADVLNDLTVNDQGEFQLPNLISGSPLDVVVRFKIPALAHSSDLCTIHLSWTDPHQARLTQQAVLHLPVVTAAQFETLPLNQDVQQQVVLMMAARAKKEAIRLVDRGEFDGASAVLQEAKKRVLDSNVPMSAPEAEQLGDLDEQLRARDIAGSRKMAQYQTSRRSSSHSRGHTSLFYALGKGIILGDILQQHTDAIVNSTDRTLSATGALSSTIHRAAGAELLAACQQVGECPVGEARITPGFKLPAQWVIHTVCPAWNGGNQDEEALLAQCYSRCIELASSRGIRALALPALGTGKSGFPPDIAARIALETVSQFLLRSTEMGRIRFVCADATVHMSFMNEFQRIAGW
ncbi:macro domain-containing protein [Phormidium sp. CLA17]|uniref:macro domain-containing protein n=1 Tax=Leptolyngbya sp. Cla-17 TaxID=2803751 RepID=UPI0014930FC1|nr:macro domain-containing protein [Leptolyngbya sp. Cla-17]MBM0743768.1 macro domain-containing protein [Leptolyngbya sp. Cla-17]